MIALWESCRAHHHLECSQEKLLVLTMLKPPSLPLRFRASQHFRRSLCIRSKTQQWAPFPDRPFAQHAPSWSRATLAGLCTVSLFPPLSWLIDQTQQTIQSCCTRKEMACYDSVLARTVSVEAIFRTLHGSSMMS